MAELLIRQLPEDLHRRLKARARANRRSMNQEVLVLLEQSLATDTSVLTPPRPLEGAFPISDEWLYQVRQEGRA